MNLFKFFKWNRNSQPVYGYFKAYDTPISKKGAPISIVYQMIDIDCGYMVGWLKAYKKPIFDFCLLTKPDIINPRDLTTEEQKIIQIYFKHNPNFISLIEKHTKTKAKWD